jgi:hypothetical protein
MKAIPVIFERDLMKVIPVVFERNLMKVIPVVFVSVPDEGFSSRL